MAAAKRNKSNKKHRNCIDRIRQNLMKRQRQRRGGDPASKLLLQLLQILTAWLVLVPTIPSIFPRPSRPRPSEGVSSPSAIADQALLHEDTHLTPMISHEMPFRSAQEIDLKDEDRGPTAYAMERGLEPAYYRTSSRAAPTWSKLVKDLKRRRTKDNALALLELRVPVDAVEWLRTCVALEEWQSLQQLGRDNGNDEKIAAAAAKEAKRWAAMQLIPQEIDEKPKEEAEGSGDPVSGAALKPPSTKF